MCLLLSGLQRQRLWGQALDPQPTCRMWVMPFVSSTSLYSSVRMEDMYS